MIEKSRDLFVEIHASILVLNESRWLQAQWLTYLLERRSFRCRAKADARAWVSVRAIDGGSGGNATGRSLAASEIFHVCRGYENDEHQGIRTRNISTCLPFLSG